MRVYEEARQLLQPLVKQLATERASHDERLYLLCSDRASGSFLAKRSWINVDVSHAQERGSELQLTRAFIEVVAQLAKAPDFQWRQFYHTFWKDALMTPLLCTICTDSAGEVPNTTEYDSFEQLQKSDGPRFYLDFGKTSSKGAGTLSMLESLRLLMFLDPSEALGESNAGLLAELAGDDKRSLATASQPGAAAEIGLVLPAAGLTTSEFRDLEDLLDDIVEHEDEKLQTASGSASRAVRFEISTLWIASTKSLEPMEIQILASMISSKASTIRQLCFENAYTMLAVMESLQAFEQLLRSCVCSLDGRSQPTLETLELWSAPFENPHLGPICSALRYPNSLKKLHIDWAKPDVRDDVALMWAWVAFGIFHPDSEAKLDRLNLSGPPLALEDTTAFASILRTPHPGKLLWVLEHGSLPQGNGLEEVPLPDGQRVFVQLKLKTKFRAFPKVRSQALAPVVVDAAEEFEVAIALAAWTCVFVPGCGFGWVPSASILERREVPSKCPPYTPPANVEENESEEIIGDLPLAGVNVKAFDRFTLIDDDHSEDFSDDEDEDDDDDWCTGPDAVEAIKMLLGMIGHCLEEFNYPSHDIDVQETDLAELLECCPKLTHLNLMGNMIVSLAPLIERYRTQQCRIKSLNIHTVEDQDHIVTQLAELLESPASKPLQYVAVNGMVQTPESLDVLASALKKNQTLQLLYTYSVHLDDSHIFSRMQSEFESVNRVSRLETKTKVAFLSVIEAHSTQDRAPGTSDPSSLGKLDSSIASQIFAFAGIPIPRTMIW